MPPMLSRCVTITIAVCLLAALPIIVFHSLDEQEHEQTEQVATSESAVGTLETTPESSNPRLDQMSIVLYGTYASVCLLIVLLLMYYAHAYKRELLKSKYENLAVSD